MREQEQRQRLNRAIAASGYCSRRKADQLIADGRVTVNGVVKTEFNTLVDLDMDDVTVNGKPIGSRKKEYLAFYKPRGIMSTCSDEQGRTTVIDVLPSQFKHLKPVGRLDKESEGLLILTNDGDIAFHLAHPSHQVWKKYSITVSGKLDEQAINNLANGVELSDGITRPARIWDWTTFDDKSTFHISISEGRNRQLRRMCAQIGYPVIGLVRVAIGRLQLKPMGPGEWRQFSKKDIVSLCLDQTEE